MSSDSNFIILSSDTDVEDVMSSTAIIPPTHPAPQSPLLASGEDTEAFEEDEVAPTPQISPIAPPAVTLAPSDPSSPTTFVHPEPTLMFRRRKTIIGPRKKVRLVTPAPRIPAVHTSPPPSATPTNTPTPTLILPLKKRARFTTPASPITETSDLPPPPLYHIGESSRAATARGPTALTLDAQLGDQQEQIDRLRYQVDEILSSRLEVIEEDVEGLVLGRVGIDVSYHGLETRQMENHEQIDQLRDELPEIRDRAQMTQEAQGRQAHELALAQDRLTVVENREAAL